MENHNKIELWLNCYPGRKITVHCTQAGCQLDRIFSVTLTENSETVMASGHTILKAFKQATAIAYNNKVFFPDAEKN